MIMLSEQLAMELIDHVGIPLDKNMN